MPSTRPAFGIPKRLFSRQLSSACAPRRNHTLHFREHRRRRLVRRGVLWLLVVRRVGRLTGLWRRLGWRARVLRCDGRRRRQKRLLGRGHEQLGARRAVLLVLISH